MFEIELKFDVYQVFLGDCDESAEILTKRY